MTQQPTPNQPPKPRVLRERSRALTRTFEGAITCSLALCAIFSILVTASIVFVLFSQSIGFFKVHGDDSPGRPNRSCSPEGAVGVADSVKLSEIRIHAAADREIEYVEISGPPGAPVGDLTYVVIAAKPGEAEGESGGSGIVRAAVAVAEERLGTSGLLTIGNQKRIYRKPIDQVAELGVADSDNQTHLLVRGFTGAIGEDLDADDDGTLDLRPWSQIVDEISLVEDTEPTAENHRQRFYADATVGPSYGHVPWYVYRCRGTGQWEIGSPDTIAVSPVEFLSGTQWNPLLGAVKHYGVLPLLCGTLLVSFVAMCITVPFGLVSAIYLSEFAPRRVRAILKPTLEILGGIPTVVYGYFALMVITPVLKSMHLWVATPFKSMLPPPEKMIEAYTTSEQFAVWISKPFESYNVMSAGIAVGIMTLPIVCSLSEDALQAVPRSLREGAYGIGATKFEVSTKVIVPAALSGIVAAFLLAIARAFGETMIVALAAGNLAHLTVDPRESTQTMTAWIVQIFLGDASNFGPEYLSCYVVAATLFVMTLILTLIGGWVLRRYREVYH